MLAYYAHCMNIYDTPQEKRDLELLEALGFAVFNPNLPGTPAGVAAYKEAHPGEDYMEYFRPLVTECDVFSFRALPDGSIPAGVAKEITYAQAANIPIFELPAAITRRSLGIQATREYLHEAGFR